MATKCKNCDNTSEGDFIFQCDNCLKKYCDDCFPEDECGNCGAEWDVGIPLFRNSNFSLVDSIHPNSEDENEEDDNNED